MRPYDKATFPLLLMALLLPWRAVPARAFDAQTAAGQNAPLTVDQDPVRSPDTPGANVPEGAPLQKQGKGFVLHANVDEVVLNATVLNGNRLVQNLTKNDFTVVEDGVKQTILSFQHTDLPVSMGL
ncbi:MAG TPA: hypothetical protein VF730_12505, partial [Terracidiphilus sp.]